MTRSRPRKPRNVVRCGPQEPRFNKPLGITETLPYNVQRLLSLGGGFAIPPPSVFAEPLDHIETMQRNMGRSGRGVLFDESIKFLRQRLLVEERTARPNGISRAISSALRYIRTKGWVVKEADKNLGLVLMSQTKYLQLLEPELQQDFVPVPEFPHSSVMKNVERVLKVAPYERREKELILKRAADRLEPSPFYIIPKIHKPVVKARPITANHSYVLSELSQRLSRVLNREVEKLRVITVNSKQFVGQVERLRLPPNVVMFTYDVERLYPSIDIADAMTTLKREFPQVFLAKGAFWLRVLSLIMYNNYVRVEDRVYRQTKGTATGTAVAPAFANLYLWAKFRPVFRTFARHVIFQRRYIDDGFGLVRREEDARALIHALNGCSNLDLTYTVHQERAVYLDVEVYKGERWAKSQILDVSIYTKPISKFLYLHGKSNHPAHVLTGIVKGELIRFLRNTSSEHVWNVKIQFLLQKLSQRGYGGHTLRQAVSAIKFSDRPRFLDWATPKGVDLGEFVVLPYHPTAKPLWRSLMRWIVARHWNVRVKLPMALVFCRTPTIRSKAISNRSWSNRQVASDSTTPAKRRRLNPGESQAADSSA